MSNFNATILNIQDALVTLIATITDPVAGSGNPTVGKTQDECGVLEANLPAIWVRRGRLTGRSEISADLYEDTRQYQALVYVQVLATSDDETAFDNAATWLDPMHKHLASNRNLSVASAVIDVGALRDSGDVSVFTRDGKRYAGVAFTIPVQYMTRF